MGGLFGFVSGDSASSADVQVNCHSKMRLSLRELEQRVNLRRLLTVQRAGSSASSYQRGCLRLSRALRSRIVAFAAGGSEERLASFRAQRARRLKPVTSDGLTRMACD